MPSVDGVRGLALETVGGLGGTGAVLGQRVGLVGGGVRAGVWLRFVGVRSAKVTPVEQRRDESGSAAPASTAALELGRRRRRGGPPRRGAAEGVHVASHDPVVRVARWAAARDVRETSSIGTMEGGRAI